MSLESANFAHHLQPYNPHTQPVSKKCDRVTQVFKNTTEAKQKEADKGNEGNEREYYVKDIMETKGVTREVAEAEYDSFS